MLQITTPTNWAISKRNAAVVAADIRCQALDCVNKATRWSNLCGLCEKQWLEDHKPVFGKPTSDQLKVAQKVLKGHYEGVLKSGVFDDWSSQIGRTFSRPESRLVAPSGMRRYRTPTERFTPLLAMRTRDRGTLTKRGVLSLLGYALVIDALITPTIPAPVRNDYMIALLGQRFVGREVYSKTTLRYRSRRVKTGVVRYGPDGPKELTQRIEEEVPEKEYYRIRRADMRFIGRRLWKAFETMMLASRRSGSEWQDLIRKVLVKHAEQS